MVKKSEILDDIDVDENNVFITNLGGLDKNLKIYTEVTCRDDKCQKIDKCQEDLIMEPRSVNQLDNEGKKQFDNSEKIFEKIMDKSECAFDKAQSSVCSPSEYIEIFKSITQKSDIQIGSVDSKLTMYDKESNDKNIKEKLEVIEKMKKITGCESEKCIINETKSKLSDVSNVIKEYFKPEGPKDRTKGWLSNSDIDTILEQLEKKHTDFYHINFQMADFDKKTYKEIGGNSGFININLLEDFDKYKKNKFAVVFNTDTSDNGGQHWYCLYGYRKDKKVVLEYFNSAGEGKNDSEIQLAVVAWLCKQKQIFIKNGYKAHISFENNIKIQNNGYDCGVYCIMYIYARLEGVHNLWLADKKNFNDRVTQDARKFIFSYI